MADGFDVDPEAIRGTAFVVRDSLEPLVSAGGQLPTAEAGLMTLVIERAVQALLEGLTGYAGEVATMADDMVRSALHYHWADQQARADFAALMVPGTTPAEAQAMVADAPGSPWAQVEEEQVGALRDLLSDTGPEASPTSSDGAHGDGLEGLLLGPMQDSTSPPVADGDGDGRAD
jgi:hypothetical protein